MKLEHQLQMQAQDRSHKAQVTEMDQRMTAEIRHLQAMHKMELQVFAGVPVLALASRAATEEQR